MGKVLVRHYSCLLFSLFVLSVGCQQTIPPQRQSSSQSELRPSSKLIAATEHPVTSDPQSVLTIAAEGSNDQSITASAEWVEEPALSFWSPKAPSVWTNLKISGEDGRPWLCLGNLRIEEAFAGEQWLRSDLKDYSTLRLMSQLRPLVRQRDDQTGALKERSLGLAFLYPGKPIEKISRLKGYFEVVTAGRVQTYSSVKVAGLSRLAETDPTLKDVGLTFTTIKDDDVLFEKKYVTYILKIGAAGVISDIAFYGRDSKQFFGDSVYWPTGGAVHHRLVPLDMASDDDTISFSVHTHLKRSTIPFDLSNIPIKPLPAPVPPDLAQSHVFVASETNAAIPQGLRIDGRFDWGERSGTGNERLLVASIELAGPVAWDIARLGSPTVTSATVSGGELHWRQPEGLLPPMREEAFPMFGTFGQGNPVSIDLKFDLPKQTWQTCQELAGELPALFVDAHQTVAITEFPNPNEGVLQHPYLDKFGIKMRYIAKKEKDHFAFDVVLNAIDWANVGGVEVFSSTERSASFAAITNDSFRRGNEGTYHFILKTDEFPPARVEVDINTQFRRKQLPYRFLNLPIPPDRK